MAIAPMTKVMIASYRSDAGELLEALQKAGILQVLDAQRAMVSKEWPELRVESARPRDIEELVSRLASAIDFLKQNATEKDATNLFDPLLKVAPAKYAETVNGEDAINLLTETEKIQSEIARCGTEIENAEGLLEKLGKLNIDEKSKKELATLLVLGMKTDDGELVLDKITEAFKEGG